MCVAPFPSVRIRRFDVVEHARRFQSGGAERSLHADIRTVDGAEARPGIAQQGIEIKGTLG